MAWRISCQLWFRSGLLIGEFHVTFASVFLIYYSLGRRKLMLFAAAGQCACMAILAGTVWDGGHAAGLVATVMLFLFNFFFGVGLLAIPWLCMFSMVKLSDGSN